MTELRASGRRARREQAGGDPAHHFIWSFSLREALALVLIADLVALSKYMTRVPIHIPGHTGVIWIALMLVGRGLLRKPGAGFLIGLIAGILATVMGLGNEGLLIWTKYTSAGLVIDAMAWMFRGDLTNYAAAAVAGAAAHLGKLVAMIVASLIMRLPASVVFAGLGLSATTHLVFGALGGLLGALVLRQLLKVPFLGHGARESGRATPVVLRADEHRRGAAPAEARAGAPPAGSDP